MKTKINLHIHTTCSDGGKTVAEIVQELRCVGVEYFAITDHDSVKGNVEASELAKKHGLVHIQGVELSCCFNGEAGLDESYVFHLVGLGFDLSKMQQKLDSIFCNKVTILKNLANELKINGYKLDIDNLFNQGQIKARNDIAQALISKNYAKNTNEAFEKILNADKFRPFAKNIPSIKEGIDIVKSCKGLAIWAHPFGVARGGKKSLTQLQVTNLCKKLIEYGIDGIECYYHKYNAEQIKFLTAIADKHNLIKSIATDYHHSPFNEKEHPELIPLKQNESLIFKVKGIQPNENNIINALKKHQNQ